MRRLITLARQFVRAAARPRPSSIGGAFYATGDDVATFNQMVASWTTPEAQARRDAEREDYERRYEAWRETRRTR